MSMIQFSPRLWAAAGVTAAAAVASNAAVAAMLDATVSPGNAAVSVPFSGLLPGGTATGATPVNASVSQFDPSLGTLTGISLTMNESWESGATATVPLVACGFGGEAPVGNCSYDLNAAFMATGVMTTPEGQGTASQVLSGSKTITRNADSGPGNDTVTLLINPATGLGLPAGFGTNLLPYQGVGTWELLFNIEVDGVVVGSQCTGVTGSAICADTSLQTGTLTGTPYWYINGITVAYTYDPVDQVPEPSSLALFSVALGALGAAGLRRRRRRD